MNADQKMRPIWYFVGWILMLIGIVVTLSGIYNIFKPPSNVSVLQNIHPDIWWGVVLIIVGCIYTWMNKNVRIES